ncbi:MAG: hypothetical protein HN712_06805 [Gemmatimonadetes bacterium]|jgi:hypothetical protein|nr:hypothetical protein [Gemmatimonadota bacterium]MBT7860005.1 hypothetical protein [Gemmatimonadota bacterium]
MTNQKSICICGSMAFIDEMESMAASLRIAGYAVATPISEESSSNWDSLSEDESFALKRNYIDAHLAKIKQSDLVLLANYPKNGIGGYIGANSLMEAAFAYALGIPVAYLEQIGEQPCRLEALSISQAIVGEDISAIDSLFE